MRARLAVALLVLVAATDSEAIAASAAACAAPTFVLGVPTPAAEFSFAFATADFNGDGIPDVAVANPPDVSVTIAFGSIDGFVNPVSLRIDIAPKSVATADFNQDGHQDFAVAGTDTTGHSIASVWLGAGDGTFAHSGSFPVTEPVSRVLAGDFTGDGFPDVLTASHDGASAITMLPGDGAGQFGQPLYFPLGGYIEDVVVADFNGDGRLDIAASVNPINSVGGDATLRILLGSASGGFVGPTVIPIGDPALSLAAADFNLDGRLDLALAFPTDNVVSLLLGDGAGGFSIQGIVASASEISSITAADFNADGRPDLAVAGVRIETFPNNHTSRVGMVDVLWGNGSGGFESPRSFISGQRLGAMVPRDADANGTLDIIITITNSVGGTSVVPLLNWCGVADTSVTVSDSADPVQPNSGPMTFTIDVANQGPDAAPAVLRMLVADDSFSFVSVTSTQGRCTNGLDQGVLTCWLGTLGGTAPSTARITLSMYVQSQGLRTSTARVTSGGTDPNLQNNQDVETTRVAYLGGQILALRYPPGGPVQLQWNAGDFEAGYFVGRYVGGTTTILPSDGVPLPQTATSFTDASPVTGQINCYVVSAIDPTGAEVGRSDMLCVQPGTASGVSPSSFSITLNRSLSTKLAWSAPGGQTGYMLAVYPLDGSSPSMIPLPGTQGSYTHYTTDVPTCFVIIPGNGATPMGHSDALCSVPGQYR